MRRLVRARSGSPTRRTRRAAASDYLPVINGSDNNFTQPFVLDYPHNGFPTDKPRPELYVDNLTGFTNGSILNVTGVIDTQLWGADSAPCRRPAFLSTRVGPMQTTDGLPSRPTLASHKPGTSDGARTRCRHPMGCRLTGRLTDDGHGGTPFRPRAVPGLPRVRAHTEALHRRQV